MVIIIVDARSLNSSFGTANRPFVPMVSPVQAELRQTSNFEEERNLLKQKRIEVSGVSTETPNKPITLLSRASSVEKSPECVNTPVSSAESSSPESLVEPDPSLTTCVNQVVRLATVYSACLDANLVPNITSELYLIFTMLTFTYKCTTSEIITNSCKNLEISSCSSEKRGRSVSEDSSSCVLSSVHNCVMFASAVIDKQNELVQCLDKTVVRLLLENSRLSLFVPHIIPQLVHIAEVKVMFCYFHFILILFKEELKINLFLHHSFISKQTLNNLNNNNTVTAFNNYSNYIYNFFYFPVFSFSKFTGMVPVWNKSLFCLQEAKEASGSMFKKPVLLANGPVLYQTETDNREYFSSDAHYFFFKKQRDIFYEILHEWRTSSNDNFWATKRFPSKVQSLLGLSSDPVNMMHLARLFCAQLIMLNVRYE